ncbi:hypothetical protein TNCV_550491 [Trichonephila clavipes]|nr:hypothetical protein TNCV_550491 [Trichonephila clavipes]
MMVKDPSNPHECVKILHQVRRKCPEVSSFRVSVHFLNVDKQYTLTQSFTVFRMFGQTYLDAMSWKDAANTRGELSCENAQIWSYEKLCGTKWSGGEPVKISQISSVADTEMAHA